MKDWLVDMSPEMQDIYRPFPSLVYGLEVQSSLCNMEIVGPINPLTQAIGSLKKAVQVLQGYITESGEVIDQLRGIDHYSDTVRTIVLNRVPLRGLRRPLAADESLLTLVNREAFVSGKTFDAPSRALIVAETEAIKQSAALVTTL